MGAYRLEYSSEDGRVGEAEIPGAATSYVLSDLTPGMSYTLTLSAERGLSRSAPVTVSASTGGYGSIAPHYAGGNNNACRAKEESRQSLLQRFR